MTTLPSVSTANSTLSGPADVPVTLIARTIRTLEIVASGPITAAELGRRLRVNRSTALRLLSELIAAGYVSRDPVTKRFTLVPSRLLDLVAGPETHANWSQIIDPVLAEIRDTTGDATILGVPARQTMVYIAFFSTFHVIAISERVGTVRPMHCSALGKAYLSALDPAAFDSELSLMTYTGGTERAVRTEQELRARVQQAREDGYALDVDETFDHVRCVAVPVRVGESVVGAIGISGPASRLEVPRLRELGGYLVQRSSSLGSASTLSTR
jgi:IclR family acetate operon transcriptional repressor